MKAKIIEGLFAPKVSAELEEFLEKATKGKKTGLPRHLV